MTGKKTQTYSSSCRWPKAMLVTLLVLSGCGSTNWEYSKPGVSEQQAAEDNFECKQASRRFSMMGSEGRVVGGTNLNREVWIECLQTRGYT